MLAINIALVVLVAVAIGAYFISRIARQAIDPGTTNELARAARMLDRVVAADDVMPGLPANLRQEIDVFLAQYYKELGR